MDKQKSNRKNYGTAYYAMAFLAAFFFEFYWIMSRPYEYFMLFGIGIIMIIMGYLTVDSILKAKADSDALRAEQNDMMLKAQKAIYIATKKNTKDAEARQRQNLKAVELMMNKMITTQQALLEEKKPADNDMSTLIDQLSASNAKLAKEVQSAITVNQLVKANADLVKNVRDALSASAAANTTPADLSAYVNEAVNNVPTPKVQPEPVVIPEPVVQFEADPVVVPEPVVQFETDPIVVPEPEIQFEPEPVVIPEPEIQLEPAVSLDLNTDLTMNAIEDEINLAEMEASETIEEITIPDEMTPELDAAIDDGSSEEIMSQVEDTISIPVDDSPNRQLTEEEIAALFASL